MIRFLLLLIAVVALPAPALAADPSIEDGSAQVALDAAEARWAEGGGNGHDLRFWQKPPAFLIGFLP